MQAVSILKQPSMPFFDFDGVKLTLGHSPLRFFVRGKNARVNLAPSKRPPTQPAGLPAAARPELSRALIELMKNRNPDVRHSAVCAVGGLQSLELLPKLPADNLQDLIPLMDNRELTRRRGPANRHSPSLDSHAGKNGGSVTLTTNKQ